MYYTGKKSYEGKWKDGRRHGKGIEYYFSDEQIKYDGNFTNDKFVKGKKYDRNGKIKYEGEFENDKLMVKV